MSRQIEEPHLYHLTPDNFVVCENGRGENTILRNEGAVPATVMLIGSGGVEQFEVAQSDERTIPPNTQILAKGQALTVGRLVDRPDEDPVIL